MNLVSIIIPAYNAGDYLKKCVYSILHQTYTDYEIIIIDDGSTDNTYQICEELASKDYRVKIHHQENRGVSIARNDGINYAIGKYIIFVDSDDMLSPQYLEILVRFAEKADLGIIGYTSQIENLETDTNVRHVYENPKNIIDGILCGVKYDGYLWNKIFQRSIIVENNLKFKENVTVWEDLLFVLEYLSYSSSVIVSESRLYYYRYRENSAVHVLDLDKYKSKYEVISEIKEKEFTQEVKSKSRVLCMYYEVTFSYLNQLVVRAQQLSEVDKILNSIDILEMLSCRKIVFVLKMIYLRLKSVNQHR